VIEPALSGEQLRERVFAGVAERRMADVVAEGERLDEVFVEGEGPGERAGDARDFERVGEPAAVVVALLPVNTCVLWASRRNAAECTMRSRSRW